MAMGYARGMTGIGWIMFWKAIVAAIWFELTAEHRKRKRIARGKRNAERYRAGLLYEEWKRRTAEQPLALVDLRSETAKSVGAVHESSD